MGERGVMTLGERLSISHLPSVAVGLTLAARGRTPSAPLRLTALLGPTVADAVRERYPTLSVLPDLGDHGRRVADEFEDSRVFVGDAATVEALHPPATEAWMLYVLAHGVAAKEKLRPSSLVFAPTERSDGIVGCTEFESLRWSLPPELVFLGACGARRAPVRRGDDASNHLGGALLFAGTNVVLLSRDNLELVPTIELVSSFFEGLKRGDSPADSMRRARVSLARTQNLDERLHLASIQVLGTGQRGSR